MSQVSRVLQYQVSECPSAFWVPECSSAWVPKFWSTLSSQVPKCPSALCSSSASRASSVQVLVECPSVQVSWVLGCPSAPRILEYFECPSALWVPEVLECLSALSTLGVSGVRVLECLKCLESQSVSLSQLVSQPVSQLIYNTYSVSYIYFKCSHTLRKDLTTEYMLPLLFKYSFNVSGNSYIRKRLRYGVKYLHNWEHLEHPPPPYRVYTHT